MVKHKMIKQHFLFICDSNIRGAKAAELFDDNENIDARAAALFPLTGTPITKDALRWASKIFVFNEKDELQKTQLLQKFPDAEDKEIIDLNMPREISSSNPEFERLLMEKITL